MHNLGTHQKSTYVKYFFPWSWTCHIQEVTLLSAIFTKSFQYSCFLHMFALSGERNTGIEAVLRFIYLFLIIILRVCGCVCVDPHEEHDRV